MWHFTQSDNILKVGSSADQVAFLLWKVPALPCAHLIFWHSISSNKDSLKLRCAAFYEQERLSASFLASGLLILHEEELGLPQLSAILNNPAISWFYRWTWFLAKKIGTSDAAMSLFETVWDDKGNNRKSKLNPCKSKGQGLQSSMRNLKELGWLWLSGLVSRAAPPKLKSDWAQFARTGFLECDQFTIYMQPVGHFTIFICNQLLHATAATSKSCKKVSNC